MPVCVVTLPCYECLNFAHGGSESLLSSRAREIAAKTEAHLVLELLTETIPHFS
jgi:hypothetical protein